jgi:predicted RNase H-like HicB family nuclease
VLFCYDADKGDQVMNSNYTAVIKHDADWWIGWIEEVPGVNCQESTREELLKSLRETLAEAIELNRADALEAVGYGFEELSIAV